MSKSNDISSIASAEVPSARLSYRLLEPRMVFDAALVATVADAGHAKAPVHVDAAHDTGHDDTAGHAALVDVLHQAPPVKDPMTVSILPMPASPVDGTATPSNIIRVAIPSSGAAAGVDPTVDKAPLDKVASGSLVADETVAPAAAPAAPVTGENIVFIDAAVQDPATIAAHVAPGSQIVMLTNTSDGLNQIAAFLSTHHDVASIHILSHGASGDLILGDTIITDENLEAHKAALATIGLALRPGGDILLYGCSVASGTAGAQFINRIAALTGDNVAASTDATGSAAHGGNWVLEAHAGTIHTEAISAVDYAGLLQLAAVDDTNSVAANATVPVTGNVLTNDSSTGTKTVTEVHGRAASVGVAYATSYGSITLRADGTYSYTVDPNNTAVHGLIAGQTLVDIISYTGRDTASVTPDYGVLTITINGINDPPIAYDNVASVTPTSAPAATGNLITDTAPGNPADYIDRPAQQFNWVNQYGNGTGAFGTNKTVGTGANAVTVSVTHSDPSAVGFTGDGVVSTATQGGLPGYLQLYISPDGHTTGNATTGFTYTTPVTNLAFSQPVSNLEFTILDADTSRSLAQFQANNPSTWIDQVTINATRNGQPVTFHAQYSGYDTRTGNSFAGNNVNVLPTDANGNIHIVFDGPVDSVAIGFNDGAAATGYKTGVFGSHLVGISNLSWQSQGGERITQITTMGSTNTAVAAGGSVTVAATYGTITVASNGTYTYNVDPTNAAVRALPPGSTLVDNVPYTVVDTNGLTATAILHVTVNGINDAPAGTDHTSTVNEDTPYTFAAADFGFTDPVDSPGNTFQSVVITTLPPATDGVLKLSGVAVTAGQELTVAQIASLTFTPAANVNGAGLGTFTFQVRDNGGTANGGVDLDQSPNTFKFNVTPVNDAPVSTVPGTQTVLEDTPLVFSGANAITVFDVDAAASGQETVTLSVGHGTVTLGSTAGITGLSGNGSGSVTFTGTIAQVNAALSGLKYQADANYNGTDALSVAILDDGKDNGVAASNGALSSVVKTVTINVTSVNDAPAGTDHTSGILEDQPYTFAASDFGFTDLIDTPTNTFQSVVIKTLPVAAEGVLSLNGVAVTTGQELTVAQISNLVFIPGANRNGSGLGAFTFQVRDNGGTANGGIDLDPTPNTFNFNIQAVNDAPVSAVPGPQTVNEDSPLVFTGANAIAISDVDAGSTGQETVVLSVGHGTLKLGTLPVGLTYTNNGTGAVTLTGSLVQVNAAIAGLTYQGTANYNGSDLLTVQVKDDGTDNGVAATNGALSGIVHMIAINVVSVNDAPAGTDHTATVTENGSYAFAVADFGFTDPNDTPANTLQSVIITTLPPAADGVLTIASAGGARVAVTAGQELTPAQIATLIFAPNLNRYGTGLGAFTFQVRDGGGTANGGVNLDQSPNTFNFNVAFVNQPPVAANDSYTTNEHTTLTVPAGTSAGGNGLLANDTDVDNAHAALAVTQINGNALASGAPITLPSGAILTQNGDGSFAYNPNGVYNALTTGQTATDTFTYQVSDGAGGFATATATVNISGINDAPVAVADTNSTGPLTAITVGAAQGVLSNDIDVDTAHNLLAVSAVNGVTANVNTPVAGSNGGLFTIHADGSYSFDPNGQFNGIVATTSVTYTVTDGTNTSTTTLTIAVPYQNLPPYVAQPVLAQSSLDGSPVAIDLSHVFSDYNTADQGHLTITQSGLPPGLSLTPTTDPVSGATTYTVTGTLRSDASQHAGPYVVTLTATDPSGSTISTTFNFSVGNPAPVAVDDTNSVLEHGAASGNVLTNDHDGANDHDPLSVSLVNGKPFTPGNVIALASGAQVVIGADGTYTYDTHGAFNGLAAGVTATDQFTYQVSDGQGGFATATATITITGQNDNPVVVDPAHPGTPPADPNHIVPSQTGLDGTAVTPLNVTGFFHDPDNGDTLTLSTTGQLPPGVTFDPATGTFSGTPTSTASQGGPANNGVYSVLVSANDGHGGIVSTVVTFSIANPPPVAGSDSSTVLEHGTTAGNVLTNDHDGGGDTDPLMVATVNGQTVASGATITLPSGALLVMNANGQYTYDPHGAFASLNANQSATDTFTYTISDGQGGTAEATVTIQIQGQNDNPVALRDTNTTNPQVPVTADAAHGVLANDSDVEHDPLAVSAITNGTTTVAAGTAIAGAGGGTFTINLDGSYTFNPGTDFNNLAAGASATSSVTYTVIDGHGGQSTSTLTVTVPYENLPPVVKQPIPTQNSLDGNAVTIPVTGVFSDPNTIDTLTITATGLPPGLTFNPATGAIEGTLTSAASQHGGVPYTVTLMADDGHGGSTTSTFSFNVGNPPPVASADSNAVTEHGTITNASSVLGNDHDGLNDHDPLSVSQVNGAAFTPGGTITLASGALLVMQTDGTYSYDPNSAFNGLSAGQTATDHFSYQVSDGQGGVSTATVTITITGQNEPPVVIDPAHPGTPPIDPNHIVSAQTGQDGSPITPLDVKGYFTDPDKADTLTLSVNPAALPTGVTFLNGVFGGTPDANASQHGNVTGMPGVYDVVVTASDGQGGTVSTTVRFTVSNPAPVASSDVNSVAEHGTIANAASVLANDHDGGSDTDPLTVTQVNGTAVASGSTIVLPSGAHLVMNTDGTYSYDPHGSFVYLQVGQATTDHFTYQVSDGQGGFSTATVTITINGQNDAPTAANDASSVAGATASVMVAAPLGVLANDADPEHGVLTVSTVNVGSTTVAAGSAIHGSNGGTFTVNADGSYAFDPGSDFLNLLPGQVAQSSVTYTVTDDHGATATATLTITVPYENLPPVLNQIVPAQSSFDGNAVLIDVTNVFKDPNGDTISIQVDNLPPGLTYDPVSHLIAGSLDPSASTHSGPYVVKLTANDGHGGTMVTTFNFTVNNQPPVAGNDTNTVAEHGTVTGTSRANDHDGGLDTDPIAVNLVNGGAVSTPITLASGASVTMQPDGSYVYNTNSAFNGLALGETATDSFTYQITDSQGATATATVSITITGQNDAPVVVDPAHPGQPVAAGTQVVPTTSGLDGSAISPVTVTGYFADPDHGDHLTLAVDPASVLPAGITFDPVTGTFSGTLGPDASIGGPDPAHPGTYPVTVTANDGHGGTVSTLVVFHIANPAPVAANDANTVLEHGTTTGNVLANDHDGGADTDVLHVSQVNGTALTPGATIPLASGARLVMAADGAYTYDPNGAYSGLGVGQTARDTFTYQVSDGQGGFATATAVITINGQNDAPIVVDPATGLPPADPQHVVPGQPAADGSAITPVNVTAFFHDPDNGDHLTLSVDPASLPAGIVFNPSTGTFSGTPAANASQGGPDAAHPGVYPITVTATDASGATVTTVVTFAIINPPPVAVADTASVAEHGTTTGNVLTNDHDGGADTDMLTVTAVNGHALVPGTTITLPSGALLTMKADGTYAYNPNGVFQSLSIGETGTDTFTYLVSDGNGGFATATVAITVVGENDPPVVVDPAHPGTAPADPLHVVPAVSGNDGTTITPISVANVFHDPDGHDTLTFSVPPGTLPPGITFNPITGVFSGTPGSDASQGGPHHDGTYPIVVTASDGHGGTVSTIVTFTFTNVPPVASNDAAVGKPGETLNIDVLGNDHDGGNDHDPLVIVAASTNTGKVSINPNGSLDFTPAPGFVGLASITYTISDGQGGFSTATATVLITPDIHVAPPASPNLPGIANLAPSNAGISAQGAVLDAVHGADAVGSGNGGTEALPTGIAATGIVDIAANQVSSLGGIASRVGSGAHSGQSGYVDPRTTSPVWQLQNLISQRFGAPSENWNPEGLTGFSLRYTFAADPLSNAHAQIVLDSIVRDRTLIVNLSSTAIPDHAHVVEYRVMQADGRALPGWLDHAGNVLIGEHPVDTETVKLHVVAVMSDGSTIERDVVIQTNSGEIQPLKETKRSDMAPLFSEQIRQFAESDQTEFERLVTALAG